MIPGDVMHDLVTISIHGTRGGADGSTAVK